MLRDCVDPDKILEPIALETVNIGLRQNVRMGVCPIDDVFQQTAGTEDRGLHFCIPSVRRSMRTRVIQITKDRMNGREDLCIGFQVRIDHIPKALVILVNGSERRSHHYCFEDVERGIRRIAVVRQALDVRAAVMTRARSRHAGTGTECCSSIISVAFVSERIISHPDSVPVCNIATVGHVSTALKINLVSCRNTHHSCAA